MQIKKFQPNSVEDKIAKLAVLIDADNASPMDIKYILDEVTRYGDATVKRIYGNFTSGSGGAWKQCINDLAIKPMQQFAYTTGKNATDGFLIIDAMDLLYTDRFDGFCIVSSDSDFTALAIRIKEQNATVYGFGKKQTPTAFINACSHFIYVENLIDDAEETLVVKQHKSIEAETKKLEANSVVDVKVLKSNTNKLPLKRIKQVFDIQDTEWITVAALGSQWKRLQTDFDPRNYGFKKLSDLVKNHAKIFDYEERTVANNGHKHMYVRLKAK